MSTIRASYTCRSTAIGLPIHLRTGQTRAGLLRLPSIQEKMSSANALYLLADHVKLSLLERQRAKALDLESDSQDGHISRSLDQFRDGLEALEKERQRLEEAGEER